MRPTPTYTCSLALCALATLAGACASQSTAAPLPRPEPPTAAAPSPTVAAPKATKVEVAPPPTAPIYFSFDSSVLELSENDRERLSRIAAFLVAHQDARVVIEGNADARGTSEYNLALGDRRARAAVDYLVRLGVRDAQIKFTSFGEERLADEGQSEAAHGRNRRDEIRLERGRGAGPLDG